MPTLGHLDEKGVLTNNQAALLPKLGEGLQARISETARPK